MINGQGTGLRPETGPMCFESDWRGVFIRGDNAFGVANTHGKRSFL